ncbi:hypothetical protein TRM7557_00687 [Tritonibacter multivorans]|uniref:Uncharacterized protein n=1 Tax=Tritonibacter multivorans TaxID=928856 RepID=A0A0P1G2N4_9RHOB|nr:DUF6173 family protein [Tritonibacter multivorans]MDA7419723.1 DUF6173 family protein [Tritonibacter multivorans]CUH76048.1 hypothetical protein TRM7557_00687 [Tritonibacter multivorans]SFC56296.1 hypothetical protein SAMN04488049_10395 [Tritonibacter multivorans]
MQDTVETSAELAEAAALRKCHEVHTDAKAKAATNPAAALSEEAAKAAKSPAQWAYERLILYIKNFEEQLDTSEEVAMGFVGGDAGVLRIEGMGYFDPDIVTFYGSDGSGARTQLVQHVSQLNVMLRALPKPREAEPARRIGFELASDLTQEA